MADSLVPITAGTGTSIDTRTEGTNGHHRQVVVLGDPDANAGVAPVDATNGLAVDVKRRPRASTSSVTSVTGVATSTTLKAANAARLTLDITNDSTATLYVKLGATASSTSWTYRLMSGESMPREEVYTGVVDGIWESAVGAARVTELTA